MTVFCECGIPCSFKGEQNICTKKWVHLTKMGICDQFNQFTEKEKEYLKDRQKEQIFIFNK